MLRPLRRREWRRRRGLAREGPRRRSVVNDKGSLESDSVSQAGVDNDGAEPTEVAELPEGGGAEGEAEDEEDQKAERPVPLLEQPLVVEGARKWLLATTCTPAQLRERAQTETLLILCCYDRSRGQTPNRKGR